MGCLVSISLIILKVQHNQEVTKFPVLKILEVSKVNYKSSSLYIHFWEQKYLCFRRVAAAYSAWPIITKCYIFK